MYEKEGGIGWGGGEEGGSQDGDEKKLKKRP